MTGMEMNVKRQIENEDDPVKCQKFQIFVIKITGKNRELLRKEMLVYRNDNKLLCCV